MAYISWTTEHRNIHQLHLAQFLSNNRDTELQIGGGIEDNSEIIFLISQKNICCDPSLEPSQRDGSNDGSQHTF